MESSQSSVQPVPNVVKSVSTLLKTIEKDLPTMGTRTMLILYRSLLLGIALLERKMTQKGLTVTGKRTSDIS